VQQRINTAPGAAGSNAQQPPGGNVAEIHREIRYDKKLILLRNDPCLLVVLRDSGVFVAQIHLDDLLHMLVEIGQPLVDLRALRPNLAVDELLLVIGKVHHPGEVLGPAQLDQRS